MIEESTTNRKYPLPHPENRASQDVERIATAIQMIDADVDFCSSAVEKAGSAFGELRGHALQIPEELADSVDTEIRGISAHCYLVVNEDATGFKTVEGGGGSGGLRGELLIKKSDQNFDTTWIDPRVITKKAFKTVERTGDANLFNNSTVILSDTLEIDNSDGFPRYGLTQRQVIGDENIDENFSYILCDQKDEDFEEESDLATKEKYGRVRIGDGINVDNGIISIEKPELATEITAGLVKVGEGIKVEDGVISISEYRPADHENFGVVKLSPQFEINKNGALVVAAQLEGVVYQTANIDLVEEGQIVIRDSCAKYRAFIDDDTTFNIDWSQIEIEKDLAFELEIYADQRCFVSFDFEIEWKEKLEEVPEGRTVIKFWRMFGAEWLEGSVE